MSDTAPRPAPRPFEPEALLGSHIYLRDDPRFRALTVGSAALHRVATGFQWAEGPCWFPDHQVLLFSDIPTARIMRLTADGQASVFRAGSGYANGHTRDRQGRLVSCQHGTRSVTRTEPDGSLTTLADAFEGQPLNSPNDVVVTRDGTVWFTDPTYGILSDYEGFRAAPAQPCRGVYRLTPDGRLTRQIEDFVQPNGLAFSPDERILYVAESGSSHDPAVPSVIRAFDIGGDGTVAGDRGVFASIEVGLPDGIRVDADGNLWSSAGDGVHVFAPDGTRLGRIRVPEAVANLCFGGPRMNRLYITATSSIYSLGLAARTV